MRTLVKKRLQAYTGAYIKPGVDVNNAEAVNKNVDAANARLAAMGDPQGPLLTTAPPPVVPQRAPAAPAAATPELTGREFTRKPPKSIWETIKTGVRDYFK